jgi:hypothetical protein
LIVLFFPLSEPERSHIWQISLICVCSICPKDFCFFIEYYRPVVILAYKVNCQHWFHHYLSIRKILPDPYFLPFSHYPLKSFPQMEMAFIDASLSLLWIVLVSTFHFYFFVKFHYQSRYSDTMFPRSICCFRFQINNLFIILI